MEASLGTSVIDWEEEEEEGDVLWWEAGVSVPSTMFCLCGSGKGRAVCLEEGRVRREAGRLARVGSSSAEGCQL